MTTPSGRVISQMERLVSEFASAGMKATNAAALEAKKIHLQEIARVVGSDLRMSGVGRGGARVNVRYLPARSQAGATALIRAVGPLHLVERPVKAHTIRAKRRRALGIPDGPRLRVRHPGVRSPRRPWQVGQRRAAPAVTRIMHRQYGAAFGRGVR